MKTNTVTITVFPTYKEISTPVYRGGISHQEIFENHFVSESYQDHRESLESTVTKLIDASLNGIKGRSAAKSKIEKTNYLLEHGFGYYYNSDGKISRSGSEQPADCDFYGNVPEVSPAVSPADRPAVSHVDRPAVSHADRPVVSHAEGFYTVALLVTDLELAIDDTDTLRDVLSSFRDINYYHGKLDLKIADLKIAAIALLTELKVDLADIDSLKLAKKAPTARLELEDLKIDNTDPGIVSNQCLQWLSHHVSDTPGIVMVRQNSSCNGRDVYVTYGSHAKVLGLLTGRDALSEQGFSKIEIPASAIEFYQGVVSAQGVPLTFV